MLASPIPSRRGFGNIGLNKTQNVFTARYNINKLVYFEGFESIVEAIGREKFIKGKSRKWKVALIGKGNRGWSDLSSLYEMHSILHRYKNHRHVPESFLIPHYSLPVVYRFEETLRSHGIHRANAGPMTPLWMTEPSGELFLINRWVLPVYEVANIEKHEK